MYATSAREQARNSPQCPHTNAKYQAFFSFPRPYCDSDVICTDFPRENRREENLKCKAYEREREPEFARESDQTHYFMISKTYQRESESGGQRIHIGVFCPLDCPPRNRFKRVSSLSETTHATSRLLMHPSQRTQLTSRAC